MEYKVDDIISYNEDDETIYLQVTPTRDITCHGCYFHGHKCHCSIIKNIVGECSENKRTDKQTVIFTKVNNNIMEYKIGDTFCLEDGTKLEVVKATCNCRGCYFFNDKDNRCSRTKDIICSAPRRTDKEFVIFKQIKDNNNMKKKTTIDIYVVMQMHKQYRSFCNVFTSFEEADARFEALLNHYESINKVQPRGWTTETIPSQIKVSIIGDITLYLCKETKEIDIEIDSNKQSSDIYKKDVLGKWISIDNINPIKIKGFKPRDYVILRIEYDSKKFDYKLAYVDSIRDGQVKFNIQNINITNTPIKITDFCILPSYTSDNFYK